jgi:hypothetical protein
MLATSVLKYSQNVRRGRGEIRIAIMTLNSQKTETEDDRAKFGFVWLSQSLNRLLLKLKRPLYV